MKNCSIDNDKLEQEITCPTCGLKIKEIKKIKCPRCNSYIFSKCSECRRCSLFN
ncbi:hypothetical protein [Halanaerobium sp. MA284_MarDTE_T2]|uniref:hypothetical protein n=1 Tax=Halanaerobium sp. MA284_MarDTE_T2 TaxID=2183913 RepID=UPI001313DBD1|nr:hypothetical protein [Halanaerobium sp. MA284_MarDTE_T2]